MPKSHAKSQPHDRKQQRYDRLIVLDYVETYLQAHHYSPSQRIIYRALKMSAPSVAHNALHGLERQGLLIIKTTQRGWPATLEITPLGHERLQEWRAAQADLADEVTE
jgi:DNA-binding PadR family transcriptional regulator